MTGRERAAAAALRRLLRALPESGTPRDDRTRSALVAAAAVLGHGGSSSDALAAVERAYRGA